MPRGYWTHTVEAVNPSLIAPAHCDNLTRRLRKSLTPLPFPADDVKTARRSLPEEAADGDWQVHFPRAFRTVTLGPKGVNLRGHDA